MDLKVLPQVDLTSYLQNLVPNIVYRSDSGENSNSCLDIFYNKLLFMTFLCYYHINCQFKMFVDLISSDLLVRRYRFLSIYNLFSIYSYNRLLLRLTIPITQVIDSVTLMYRNSSWYERESYDLFGIYYFGNFDLRRILNDYGFKGYAFRKDFPLVGFKELKYDFFSRRILYSRVHLLQGFRVFKVRSP